MPDVELAYLFELRLRLRRNLQGRALADRRLSLIARAAEAGPDEFAVLQLRAETIADGLALRFGSPQRAPVQ